MPASRRVGSFLGGAVRIAVALLPVGLAAQRAPVAQWTVAAPDAALAWFSVLAQWRVDGDGAFSYLAPGHHGPAPSRDEASRLLRLRRDAARSVLHFGPLYHPSADRAGLARALRAAATSAPAPDPRATFVVSALMRAMPEASRREHLPALADAILRADAPPPRAAQLAAWQRLLDSLYLPALTPYLVRERLDAGRLVIAPAIGAEGRLFAATPDRRDNQAAVGSFPADVDVEAPLLAFVREVCFPAVSRAASAAGLRSATPDAARRTSLAAVRCGATLLDACLPSRAAAYRAFWLRRAADASLAPSASAPTTVPTTESSSTSPHAAFDRVFLADAALEMRITCSTIP